MSKNVDKPIKVRGGEARKIVELPPPDPPKEGQIKYDKVTKHPYIWVNE